ncbi:hypothetical protein [Streptomyces sioyaensis]|uniref:hypothetical protein n=1 Tax=Streptomyces sioyaensis TaxID=67364 RepID=UPI003D723DD0
MGRTRIGRRVVPNHPDVAQRARDARGEWFLAAVYPSFASGRSVAARIPRADLMPAYAPAGDFEAYEARHDAGTAVWVRYIAGLPKPAPRPSTMTYRVCDRGNGPGYTGLRIVMVTVAPECPVCGGPRGEGTSYRFHEDGDWFVVDRWTNPCGHLDEYRTVLAEYRHWAQILEKAERKAAERSAEAPDAGEFTAEVALLKAAASLVPGLQARQGAQLLGMQGQDEAARRIGEELATRSYRMSARQATQFLTELAAARAACHTCDDGRINYRSRDGEFVSLRCPRCRRDVIPVA